MNRIDTAFAVPYGYAKYSHSVYKLSQAILQTEMTSEEGQDSRVGNSLRTRDNLHTLSEFEYLRLWIEKEVSLYADTCFGIKESLLITNMWGTINTIPSHWNMTHTHPDSCFSGVLWLSAPVGSGNFILSNPTMIDHWIDRLQKKSGMTVNANSSQMITITPEEGSLLLFPSYVPHMVAPNENNVQRISISFNIG